VTRVNKKKPPHKAEYENELFKLLWDPRVKDDLYRFVLTAFPWEKPGTPLAKFKGPRGWQKEELDRISAKILENQALVGAGSSPETYQSATASGRGIGKSTLTSWLILWMLSTRIGSTVIVTANNETQLKTRTWAELGKWHTLSVNSHWFERSALALKPAPWFEHSLKHQLKIDTGYYYAQAQLWNEENPEAFAGVHNFNGIMVIFDEASGIPSPIWTVTEGFFTEPIADRYHLAFSNPRRNTGEFFECFHRHREYWLRRNLDSRTVEGTDTRFLQQIIEKHGEDSDTARVEVLGQFPRRGDKQFISREVIELAAMREDPPIDAGSPIIMGVDPARFGDDSTVVWIRQGRDARSIPPLVLKRADNMEVANEIARLIGKINPDAVNIDAGNGTGVIDRLREMGYKINEIWFGAKAEDPQWADVRTEIWARTRDWLMGGVIPDVKTDQELHDDLAGPEYIFVGSNGDKIRLEPKDSMKKRGLSSPDRGDALALTLAVRVSRRDFRTSRHVASPYRNTIAQGVDYDPFDL